MRRLRLPFLLLAGLSTALAAQPHKELGRMWTLEDVPLSWFKEAYDFEPSAEWLQQAQLSALRFGQGCSASFVSPRGLIMTNHHCARGNVATASPEGQDWLRDGWFADSLADEVRLEGLTVQQLVAMRDITEQVEAGIAAAAGDTADTGDTGGERAALQKVTSGIRDAAKAEHPELEHQVVSLYQGGRYRLYSYKIYDDIRLVASPQLQAAKFGGDPDNFTFPRFSLDYTFVRAWDGDRPADTSAHYFRWRTEGPKEGETVFVLGNPGSTGRLKTVAQMEFLRDVQYPATVERIDAMLAQARRRLERAEGDPSPRLQSQVLSLENAQKAYKGYLDGLRNDAVMEIKRRAETEARARIEADPDLEAKFGDVWTEMEALCQAKREGAARETQQQEAALEKKVGEAFFALYGTAIAPDATFTLRISDGVVKGFPMNGTIAPYFTSLYGLYARHTEFGGEDPFNLPQIWLDRESQLDLKTPFNLVCTPDIIGGNSGSPLIDTEGRVVGLVFDGNIESLGNNFVFTDEVARTVCVHPAIIIASLRQVYDRGALADEIEGKASVR